MNGRELCESLSIDGRTFRGWVAAGLPLGRRGRAYELDADAVRAWLLKTGRATEPQLARTIAEVAQHFGVAPRTVAYWRADGMPGEPGRFDLEAIDAWRQQRHGPPTIGDVDASRAKLLAIEAETKQLKLDAQRGKLIEFEEVRRLVIRQVYLAKTHLDQLADRIAAALPAKIRSSIALEVRRHVTAAVDAACRSIAEELADGPLRRGRLDEDSSEQFTAAIVAACDAVVAKFFGEE